MRQTECFLVIEDRTIARVVALIPEEPERLPGLTKPVSARQGQNARDEDSSIGIDIIVLQDHDAIARAAFLQVRGAVGAMICLEGFDDRFRLFATLRALTPFPSTERHSDNCD